MPNLADLQDMTAEKMVLSAIMLNANAVYELIPILKPNMFCSQQHRLIYESMLNMATNREPIDLVTLTQYLKQHGNLAKVGGITAVTSIAGANFTAANVRHYAKSISDLYRRRQLFCLGQEIANSTEIIDDIETAIADFSECLASVAVGEQETVSNMTSTCLKVMDWIDERAEMKCPGIPSGIMEIDSALHGWQRKDLIILAARPSMGKTALAQNFAIAAAECGQKVLFFSLEMGLEQIGARLASTISHISMSRIFNPAVLQKDEYTALLDASNKMSKWPLFIDDKSGQTPTEMLAKARQVQGKHGLDLVIIDYLQIIGAKGKHENRTQEIGYISSSLKAMAKNLNVPVIVLSQLSRDVEKRGDKRPMMSDLRDGGTIEQDADVIITLYRDKYYNPSLNDNTVELDIKKNRNGKLASVNLKFVPEFMRFDSVRQT